MGKIFCLLGKSGSGKDTLYRAALAQNAMDVTPIISFTTRPIRPQEQEGREYHFVSAEQMSSMENQGKVLEKRTYDTNKGSWHYFTTFFPLEENKKYLMIITPAALLQFEQYYGKDAIVPIYLHTPDQIRLLRAIKREALAQFPDYAEVCRRYLADEEDFLSFLKANSSLFSIDTTKPLSVCVEDLLNYIKTN